MADDVLELEHIIGFTGQYPDTLCYHPTLHEVAVYNVGGVVVVADVNDPHKQEVLRGHDETVSALTVSPTGRLIASGQLGSTQRSGDEAPIFVWDFTTRREIYRLFGLNERVERIAFSFDDRLLAATDTFNRLWIWDMQTGHIACGHTFEKKVTAFTWGLVEDDQGTKRKQQRYLLSAALANGEVKYISIEFDVRSMQFKQTMGSYNMPSQGLYRVYSTLAFSQDSAFLYAGTMAGEFCVFNVKARVFRVSVPTVSNGVLSICVGSDGVFCAGGDGTVRKLRGLDQSWSVEGDIVLEGKVTSMSMNDDQTEIVVGTSHGCIHRLNSSSLSHTNNAQSHTGPIKQVAFGSRSDVYATVSSDGRVIVWDLSDYTVISEAKYVDKDGAVAVSCWLDEDHSVITGWSDGSLRCYDLSSGAEKWNRASCHKGNINSIFVTPRIVVSGGDDATIRVWNKANMSFISQFSPHQKAITKVLVDFKEPHLVHSCSVDKTVATYDLKQDKKVNYHSWKHGGLVSMAQRKDNEYELVTVGNDASVLVWDCDYPEPVNVREDPNFSKITSIDMSPSGRFFVTCGEDLCIKIWDVETMNVIAQGLCHSKTVRTVAWSPDEKQVISGSDDCSICVWNFYA